MKQCIEDFDIFFKEEQEGKSDLHLKKGFLREFGESCKCGRETTEEYNITMLFDNTNDNTTVSIKSIDIIKKIADASKNPTVHITSSVRTPRRQAEIMYEQTVSLGIAAQYNLYGSNGDKIIDVYVVKTKEKKTKDEIIQAMEDKINEIGAYEVSKHCGDHTVLNVFDISRSRLKNPNDFLTEANKYLNSEIKTIINERDRECYHFEIQQ
ncbi:MAG: hypothetical protein LBV74_22245 [Tannerella sp.]|jgi:hypothetical protein|nr:hypothetical protein [Tannerella sp.]